MWVEFNINNYARVKLTNVGRRALREWHDNLFDGMNGGPFEYKAPVEDAEGWSRWQMWELFQRLGWKMGNGLPVPFISTIQLELPETVTPKP